MAGDVLRMNIFAIFELCASYQVQFFKRDLNIASCKIAGSSTLQFPDSYILNHRIIVASFVGKGSYSAQGDRDVAFFFVYQSVRVVAYQSFFTNFKLLMKPFFIALILSR